MLCGWLRKRRKAYPRMRGGNQKYPTDAVDVTGLSPHARGKLYACAYLGTTAGPIPACAGETDGGQIAAHILRAYPRMRGGNRCYWWRNQLGRGLSPHARGKLPNCKACGIVVGPIPACAGETLARFAPRLAFGAYPRMRGGNFLYLIGS